ncbi:MAG TPA: hypothetical protein VM346_01480 [Sphingomicrobium sp.]|nr:hypothetical protein [Sphingomicrobium sp.]
MGNDRTETAREHDDSDLIEGAERAPSHQDSSGGNLARDVATQATQERVSDPEAHEGVTKEDDIAHGERYPAGRRPDSIGGR